MSEYDLEFMPKDLTSNSHLTLLDLAEHPNKIEGIPHDILEDDLPKIRPRYYSITNDPYYINDSLSDRADTLRICFTKHSYNVNG